MDMNENKDIEVIDLRIIFKRLWDKRKLFYIVLPTVFILSCLYIICIPRSYTTTTKMAPEVENVLGNGTLGDIASTFGLNLNDMQTSDAITPLLYPDLMEDNGFVAELFNIPVKSIDGDIDTTYYQYLKKHQKHAWWKYPIAAIKNLFKKEDKGHSLQFNPYNLSKEQDKLANLIRSKITLSVDKKDGVITIATEAQDPFICKTLADSVRQKLQQFITSYRTNKARTDLEYYKKLTAEAKHIYERARQVYGSYSDANAGVILESYRAKRNDLENDMQLKYNTYTALNNQLQAAKAKVQERTPAFTVIKGADVPVKPSKPKRVIFVLAMTFLAFIGTGLYIYFLHEK